MKYLENAPTDQKFNKKHFMMQNFTAVLTCNFQCDFLPKQLCPLQVRNSCFFRLFINCGISKTNAYMILCNLFEDDQKK